jgi:hypothetical protein
MIIALAEKRHVDINAWHFPNAQSRDHYRRVLDLLTEKNSLQVLISFHFDLHAKEHVFPLHNEYAAVLGNVDALAWFYEKEPIRMSNIADKYIDPWMKEYNDHHETWEKIVAKYRVRIELPFSLADHETGTPLSFHKWDVCVAGVNYKTRQIAKKSIDMHVSSQSPYWAMGASLRSISMVHRYLPAVTQHYLNQYLMKYAQWGQRYIVSKSKVNFVCGSGFKHPVRKFYEIPAARSAMVAYPFTGFEDYGFIDGENTIATLPEEAGKAVRYLLDHENIREKIANNGHKLVSTVHSVNKRVTDLIECMRRLEKGTLQGAQFIKGIYEIY